MGNFYLCIIQILGVDSGSAFNGGLIVSDLQNWKDWVKKPYFLCERTLIHHIEIPSCLVKSAFLLVDAGRRLGALHGWEPTLL